MDPGNFSFIEFLGAAIGMVVGILMMEAIIRINSWSRLLQKLLYASGAISIVAWTFWATFEVNNLLYHTALWFAWPSITIVILYLTDWLATKRAKKH